MYLQWNNQMLSERSASCEEARRAGVQGEAAQSRTLHRVSPWRNLLRQQHTKKALPLQSCSGSRPKYSLATCLWTAQVRTWGVSLKQVASTSTSATRSYFDHSRFSLFKLFFLRYTIFRWKEKAMALHTFPQAKAPRRSLGSFKIAAWAILNNFIPLGRCRFSMELTWREGTLT